MGRTLQQEYSMNKDSKVYIGEQDKKKIMGIIENMMSIAKVNDIFNIIGRAELCVNEFLTNLWKYEAETKFRIGCDFHNDILYLYFLHPGKTMDVEKVWKDIKEIEENPHPRMGGVGIFNCYKVSDRFDIKKNKDGVEMVCAFLVKKERRSVENINCG